MNVSPELALCLRAAALIALVEVVLWADRAMTRANARYRGGDVGVPVGYWTALRLIAVASLLVVYGRAAASVEWLRRSFGAWR